METFASIYAIIFGTAAVLFVLWLIVTRSLRGTVRRVSDRTVAEVRRHNPPATVADGANAWSCTNCKSVNRPDAVVCYRCRGERVDVEGFQGRI